MHASKIGATGRASFAREWGPRLARFFYFICLDKSLAETAAIETLAESEKSRSSPAFADVLRLAVARSVRLSPSKGGADQIARALATVRPQLRLAVALVKGLGLRSEEAASAMGLTMSQCNQLLGEGFLELHRALAGNTTQL